MTLPAFAAERRVVAHVFTGARHCRSTFPARGALSSQPAACRSGCRNDGTDRRTDRCGPVGRKWNGVFFCKKKWKMEGVFCKKMHLSSTQNALCTVSGIFSFYILLIWGGGAYAPNAPPAYGPEMPACSAGCRPSSVLRRLSISGNAWRASDVIRGLASLVRLRLRVLWGYDRGPQHSS